MRVVIRMCDVTARSIVVTNYSTVAFTKARAASGERVRRRRGGKWHTAHEEVPECWTAAATTEPGACLHLHFGRDSRRPGR